MKRKRIEGENFENTTALSSQNGTLKKVGHLKNINTHVTLQAIILAFILFMFL